MKDIIWIQGLGTILEYTNNQVRDLTQYQLYLQNWLCFDKSHFLKSSKSLKV